MRKFLIPLLALLGLPALPAIGEIPGSYRFETEADYRSCEPEAREAIEWLLTTPLDAEHGAEREHTARFFLTWLEGNPDIKVTIDEKTSGLIGPDRSGHLPCIFVAGYARYALDHRKSQDRVRATVAGLEAVVDFYERNSGLLVRNPTLDGYRKMIDGGTFEKFVRKQLK